MSNEYGQLSQLQEVREIRERYRRIRQDVEWIMQQKGSDVRQAIGAKAEDLVIELNCDIRRSRGQGTL